MKHDYTPRRMPRRFLDGAPDYVLDVIDHGPGGPHDRYAVIFGKSEMCRANGTYYLHGLGLSESGASYWFELSRYDAGAYRARNQRRRIAWNALPVCVRDAVIDRVEEE